MLTAAYQAAATYQQAFQTMSRYSLWRFAVIPGIISTLLSGALLVWALSRADQLGEWLIGMYPFEWGRETIALLLVWLSGILMIIIALFVFRYLVMIVSSPFMSSLSERVEAKLTGQPIPDTSLAQMISDLGRGVRIALRNIFREIILTLLLAVLGLLIPGIGSIISTGLTLIVQAYYAGFGNMDYLLERRRFAVQDTVQFVNRHRGLAIGNGAGWLALMLIPIVGWFLAPALGTTAATLSMLKLESVTSTKT